MGAQPHIAPWQIRAARAALGLAAHEIAVLASVGTATVHRAEQGKTEARPAILSAIREALEAKGITFTARGIELGAEA